MEDILAILLIFGGGTLTALAFSPIGKAIAWRLRGDAAAGAAGPELDALRDEVAALRTEVSELQERVDFSERLLAQRSTAAASEEP